MIEGQGLAAASLRAEAGLRPDRRGVPGSAPAPAPQAGDSPCKLESALLALRQAVVSAPLPLAVAGAPEARAERRKMLSQIDDYLLPRLRRSGAPILIALVGSTGAGKSTLLNSLTGVPVSTTGVRRPTTNSPVLACHPADVHWFAENVFLPALPRVRQQGLAMPGRDGLLVLAATDGMPQGVAVLDTPDIDSAVQAHREFAHQFLDASDLWMCMTSARRYADAAVWELLRHARDRGVAMSLILSRVPPQAAGQLTAHLDEMLAADGLAGTRRFVIAETQVTDDRLPGRVSGPVREWLAQTAAQEDRRVAVLAQTMAGMLDTFADRVPALAAQVERQRSASAELTGVLTGASQAALVRLDEAAWNGSLLRGEVLARWRDLAGACDLPRTGLTRAGLARAGLARTGLARRGGGDTRRKQAVPPPARGLAQALRTSLAALVTAAAERAAEQAVDGWRQHPAGLALLAERADPAAVTDAATAADAVTLTATAAERVISGWQEHVQQLVSGVSSEPGAPAGALANGSADPAAFADAQSLALLLCAGVISCPAGELTGTEGPGAAVASLLDSMLGAKLMRDLDVSARHDLRERIRQFIAARLQPLAAVLDSACAPGESLAAEIRRAGRVLEASR